MDRLTLDEAASLGDYWRAMPPLHVTMAGLMAAFTGREPKRETTPSGPGTDEEAAAFAAQLKSMADRFANRSMH